MGREAKALIHDDESSSWCRAGEEHLVTRAGSCAGCLRSLQILNWRVANYATHGDDAPRQRSASGEDHERGKPQEMDDPQRQWFRKVEGPAA